VIVTFNYLFWVSLLPPLLPSSFATSHPASPSACISRILSLLVQPRQPQVFYCKLVVADVFRRYEAAKARLEVNRAVHTRVGRFNAIAVFSFLDEGTRHLAYH